MGDRMRRVLCFGDSNTWGSATVSRPDGRYGERERWPDYMDAYEQVVQRTSTEDAPWTGLALHEIYRDAGVPEGVGVRALLRGVLHVGAVVAGRSPVVHVHVRLVWIRYGDAVVAGAAEHRQAGHDVIAGFYMGDVGSDLLDDSSGFMTEHGR